MISVCFRTCPVNKLLTCAFSYPPQKRAFKRSQPWINSFGRGTCGGASSSSPPSSWWWASRMSSTASRSTRPRGPPSRWTRCTTTAPSPSGSLTGTMWRSTWGRGPPSAGRTAWWSWLSLHPGTQRRESNSGGSWIFYTSKLKLQCQEIFYHFLPTTLSGPMLYLAFYNALAV